MDDDEFHLNNIQAETEAWFQAGSDPAISSFTVYREFQTMKDVYEFAVYFRLKHKDGSTIGGFRGDVEMVREDAGTMTVAKFKVLMYAAMMEAILFGFENGRMKLVRI